MRPAAAAPCTRGPRVAAWPLTIKINGSLICPAIGCARQISGGPGPVPGRPWLNPKNTLISRFLPGARNVNAHAQAEGDIRGRDQQHGAVPPTAGHQVGGLAHRPAQPEPARCRLHPLPAFRAAVEPRGRRGRERGGLRAPGLGRARGGAGARGGTRTPDLMITNQLLYQLSYTGTGATLGEPPPLRNMACGQPAGKAARSRARGSLRPRLSCVRPAPRSSPARQSGCAGSRPGSRRKAARSPLPALARR